MNSLKILYLTGDFQEDSKSGQYETSNTVRLWGRGSPKHKIHILEMGVVGELPTTSISNTKSFFYSMTTISSKPSSRVGS